MKPKNKNNNKPLKKKIKIKIKRSVIVRKELVILKNQLNN